MKLYVNGDSHAAAAEAVNPHAFAEDDPRYNYLKRAPHPDNWQVGWPRRLSESIKAVLHTDAESASSNARILRTTREWVSRNQAWLPETLIIIQWSTWEREEWWLDGVSHQVTASGTDDVPEKYRKRYRQWIAGLDYRDSMRQAHQDIWQLHLELQAQNVRHVFVNGNNHFAEITAAQRQDWGVNYIMPYHADFTYDAYLKRNRFRTVSPESWHFGQQAHAAWANFMLNYIIDNELLV